MASSSAVDTSYSSSMEDEQQLQAPFPHSGSVGEPLMLTVNHVYALGKDIARDMQRIGSGECTAPSGQVIVVEKIVKALEWLETYVEEVEELRTCNYRLLLKADELVKEKERRSALELELKGMQLVVDERGRQRDTLAQRVSDLESQNNHYQEQINEIEQDKSLMLRRERYSSPLLLGGTVSGTTISEEEGVITVPPSQPTDYITRTRSLDRRTLKGRKKSEKDKECNISQLQKELASEKKKVTEMRESRALEQRRIQQRLKHMEQEITSLNKQLATAQLQIEKLTREKTALLERSEVLTEVKAITLATIARGNLQTHENGECSFETEVTESPKFYKKDLLMILQDRNELKEKVSTLQDKLRDAKKKLSQYENISNYTTPNQSRGHSPISTLRRSNGSTPTFDRSSHITQRIEDSLVIVDLNNSSTSSHRLLPPSPYPPSSLAPSPGPMDTNSAWGSSQRSTSSLEDKSSEMSQTAKKSLELSTSL